MTKTRFALALFRNRASPRAECCPELLLAEVEAGTCRVLGMVQAPPGGLHARIVALWQAQVQVLVCGGITPEAAEAVQAAGILVVSEVKGESEEILRRLAAGEISVGEEAEERVGALSA